MRGACVGCVCGCVRAYVRWRVSTSGEPFAGNLFPGPLDAEMTRGAVRTTARRIRGTSGEAATAHPLPEHERPLYFSKTVGLHARTDTDAKPRQQYTAITITVRTLRTKRAKRAKRAFRGPHPAARSNKRASPRGVAPRTISVGGRARREANPYRLEKSALGKQGRQQVSAFREERPPQHPAGALPGGASSLSPAEPAAPSVVVHSDKSSLRSAAVSLPSPFHACIRSSTLAARAPWSARQHRQHGDVS